MLTCKTCGAEFIHGKRGTRPHFCSHECKRHSRRQYEQDWRDKHGATRKESERTRIKLWREQNRDYFKKYYAANKERRKQERLAWYQINRERALESCRKYDASHPEVVRAIGRKSAQSRRARKALAFVEVVDPKVVYARDKGICGLCAKPVDPGSAWHIDHIVPLSRGGEHSYANTQLAHDFCNRSKGNRIATRPHEATHVCSQGAVPIRIR